MIKKFLLGFLLLGFATIAAVVIYIFTIRTERPTKYLPVTSLVVDQHYASQSTAANEWLESLYTQYLLPSVSVAVGVDGKLVWQGVIGYADIDNNILATTSTAYRIGSVAKPMTAVVALRLQEKNIINIDNRFSDYVQDYPSSHNKITLKQLLAHQGGIRHYIDEMSENFNFTEYPDTRTAASIVEHDPLLFEPGQGFNYTTYGYTLLSLALEQATARPFEIIMQEELFSPLDLHATHFNNQSNNAIATNLSVPYLEISNSLYKSPEPNVSNKYAGGGYLSTPTDLVKFANALLGDSFIDASSHTELWTPLPLANGTMNPESYALGFRVDSDELGKFVHHGGKSVGGYTFLLIYPDTKRVIALATNITPTGKTFDRLKEAKKLARIFSVEH